MPALTPDALRAQLAKGQFQPYYLIVGDDERTKDELAAAFVSALPEEVRAFALERVSALEIDPGALVASARTLPFLGDRRVILVSRAEKWLTGRRRGAGAEDVEEDKEDQPASSAALEDYLESADPVSTLVFLAADVNRTLRLVKSLLKRAVVVECWGLKDDKEVKGFAIGSALERAGRVVVAELKKAKLTIGRDAIELLVAHAGTDITTLRGDLDRLVLYCHGSREVTRDDVAAVVSGTALVNDWGIVNAIERGNTREALRQLRLAMDSGEVPYLTLGQIGWFVRNRLAESASPARVEAAVDALFRTDLAMKTSGGEPRVLLERLVVELCAPATRRASP